MDIKSRERIAENISYLRRISNYTLDDVANYLHVSRKAYTLCETGKEIININLLIALAKLYHLRTSVLLEPDKKLFIQQITLQRMGGDEINELTDAFFELSPFSQGCLLERAVMLLLLEKQDKEGVIASKK